MFTTSGNRRVRVRGREPDLARRPAARPVGRKLRRTLGGNGEGIRGRSRACAPGVGGDARARRSAFGPRRRGRRECRLPHTLGDLDWSRVRCAGSHRRREGSRGAGRRRRGVEPRGCSARDRPLGNRRRRVRLAEGADVPTRPCVRLRVRSRTCRFCNATAPRYVIDWERTRKGQAKLDAPFTPAVSLVRALDVALGMLLDEGLEAAFDRHARLGRACREGAKAMGLELFSPDEERSAIVTAIRTPDGVDSTEVVKGLRDRFGMTIANGQGDLKGRSSASATSAGSTSLTSLPRSRRSSSSSRTRAQRSSAASQSPARSRPGPSTRPFEQVLVREEIAEAGIRLLRDRGFDVDVDADSDLAETIGGYDAIIVRSATKVTADLIGACRQLEGDRARGSRHRQRRRRGGDAPRDRRRERARVDGHLGGGAHDRLCSSR